MARKRRLVPLLIAAAMLVGCATASQEPVAGSLPKKIVRSHVRPPAPRVQTAAKPAAQAAAKPAKPIPLPDAALLKRQPPPDCELKTQPVGDAAEVRVKTLDYERQCYKEVEGVVRTRLDSLQDAVGVTIKAVKDSDSEAVGSTRK